MRATWLFVGLIGCSGNAPPDPDDWSPQVSTAGAAASIASGGRPAIGGAGPMGRGGSPELPEGGREQAGSGGDWLGGMGATGGEAAGAGGSAAAVPMAGGSGGPVAAAGRAGAGATGGAAAAGGGASCCSQGGMGGKPVAAGGSAPVDQCASMPGKLLVSYPATNSTLDGGTDPAPPPVTDHSLRVWFTSPAGYCDETFGGSAPPKLTLKNDQIGSFALPEADLCFNGNTTGEVHIDPAGGFARVMGTGTGWAVQGICVRVRRNHWTEKFHVNGDVDETWELWGTD